MFDLVVAQTGLTERDAAEQGFDVAVGYRSDEEGARATAAAVETAASGSSPRSAARAKEPRVTPRQAEKS